MGRGEGGFCGSRSAGRGGVGWAGSGRSGEGLEWIVKQTVDIVGRGKVDGTYQEG